MIVVIACSHSFFTGEERNHCRILACDTRSPAKVLAVVVPCLISGLFGIGTYFPIGPCPTCRYGVAHWIMAISAPVPRRLLTNHSPSQAWTKFLNLVALMMAKCRFEALTPWPYPLSPLGNVSPSALLVSQRSHLLCPPQYH